ncbi:hypothetical protein [Thermogymnomonas acidicola]|nr:hypothetical protein [Thermogymnomonas acidicola]
MNTWHVKDRGGYGTSLRLKAIAYNFMTISNMKRGERLMEVMEIVVC